LALTSPAGKGELVVIATGALTVSDAELRLAKALPVEVVPAMETWYEVAAETRMDAGTRNVTPSVVPEITVTFVAVVEPEGPPPVVVGSSVTVTLAGGIVPLGKPWPMTVTLVTLMSAVLGEANAFSVTLVTAPNEPESNTHAHARRPTRQLAADTRLIRKLFIVGLHARKG
jgi:hypothetical protein